MSKLIVMGTVLLLFALGVWAMRALVKYEQCEAAILAYSESEAAMDRRTNVRTRAQGDIFATCAADGMDVDEARRRIEAIDARRADAVGA